jgi:hypothetical protein
MFFSWNKPTNEKRKTFSTMSSRERKKIIEKAARLSAKDQEKLLKEYERRFGQKQFFCK